MIFDFPTVGEIAAMMDTELRAAWVPPEKGEKVPKAKKVNQKKEKTKKKKKKKDKRHKEVVQDYSNVVQEVQEAKPESKAAVYSGPSRDELVSAISSNAADLIGSDDDLGGDTPLMDAGLDSLAAVEFQSMLQKEFSGIQLPATLIFDYPSVNEIADMMYNEARAAQGFDKTN